MRLLKTLLLLCWVTIAAAASDLRIEKGELAGAQFTWAKPLHWNRNVLIIAPGFRPETGPLVAELPSDNVEIETLEKEGWLIATTSYRRNGLILTDALADLDALRAEIARRFGPPDRVLVQGDAMGALISLLLAERDPKEPPLYHGVVAVGTNFELRETSDQGAGISLQAKIPVVFLCTRRELGAAQRYAETKLSKALRPFKPALLRVSRDGPVNVNPAERLFAVRTLDRWLDTGTDTLALTDPTVPYIDATANPEPLPSRIFMDPDQHGFIAHLSEISEPNGNLLLDVQPADFAAIGVSTNAFFRATIRDHSFRVRFEKDLSAVKRGVWVAFVNADGFYWLSRNEMNAARMTGASVGDLVHIESYQAREATPATETPGENAP